MCEDLPALTALHYLQKDVADVVDHANSEEADSFRSLLSYLLAITPPKSRTPPSERSDAGSPDQGHQHSYGVVSVEDVDNGIEWPLPVLIPKQVQEAAVSEWDSEGCWERERDNCPEDVPPKKRTRSSSPLEEEGAWTSTIEGEGFTEESRVADEAGGQEVRLSLVSSSRLRREPILESVSCSTATPMTRSGAQKRSHAVLLLDEDPLERPSVGSGSRMQEKSLLSADRFCQRTEVFEAILAFIEAGAKQPDGSLLDLVDAEDGL